MPFKFQATPMLVLLCSVSLSMAFSQDAHANDDNEQYSQRWCKHISEQRQHVVARMDAKNATEREKLHLTERNQEMLKLIDRHCKNPIPDPVDAPKKVGSAKADVQNAAQTASTNAAAVAAAAAAAAEEKKLNITSTIFLGEQAAAWEAYYKPHWRCRRKNMDTDDFIFCTEDKSQQRDAFIKMWEQRKPKSQVSPQN